jgi:6-phosphogluconolactonase
MGEAGTMNNLHPFENDDLLAVHLAGAIVKNLSDAIAHKGSASLIVSGGSTPKKLFEHLSKSDLLWEKITIGLCDERWVKPTHTDSNEKLVKETLMVNNASKATFVGMVIEGMDTVSAQAACSERIKASLWPFDVVVLGMGEDAHTASLFPNTPQLPEAYNLSRDILCIAIEPPSYASHPRMSLTLKALLSAAHLYLHFQGEGKQKVYDEAMSGEDANAMPIRSILKQTTKEVEVYTA